jgi:hypothetical protein
LAGPQQAMTGGHLRHGYLPPGHTARGDRQRDTGAHPHDTVIPPQQGPGGLAAAPGDKKRGISLGPSAFGPYDDPDSLVAAARQALTAIGIRVGHTA